MKVVAYTELSLLFSSSCIEEVCKIQVLLCVCDD